MESSAGTSVKIRSAWNAAKWPPAMMWPGKPSSRARVASAANSRARSVNTIEKPATAAPEAQSSRAARSSSSGALNTTCTTWWPRASSADHR